jgi:alcohol dehydrogenase (cytochrome c)
MSTKTWRGTARSWIGIPALAVATVSGAVPAAAQDRDFEPVTDAMLADPDPADWLHWRRTLDGWGFRCQSLVTHCHVAT